MQVPEEDGSGNESDTSTGFVCLVCHKQFLHRPDLAEHELRVHFSWAVKPLDLTIFRKFINIIKEAAPDCAPSSSCSLRKLLLKALQDFETNNAREVKCIDCDFESRSRDALIRHFKVSHIVQESDLDAEEEDCGDGSSGVEPEAPGDLCVEGNEKSSGDNKVRKGLNSTPGQPRHSCGFCYGKFTTFKQLDQHVMVVHFKDRRCPICFSGLKPSRPGIRAHLASEHGASLHGQRAHACPRCRRAFKTAHTLNKHGRNPTGFWLMKTS